MTDVEVVPVTSGYNINRVNGNFEAIADTINDEVIHSVGGNNTMDQDLDMNGHSLLNLKANPNEEGSILTVGDAKELFYQIGLVPTASDPNDAVNYSQTAQMVTGAAGGIIPDDIALYSELADDTGAGLIGIKPSFTGSIHRTLSQFAEDQINSAWFGVDSTGLTGASAKLQIAITAAAGKVLVIKPGTYLIDATLLVESGTTIVAYGCTFNRSGTLNNFIRNNSNGVTGSFDANSDINIFGGKWDSTTGTGDCTVIAFTHASRCQVKDARIYNENLWHHIECNACNDVLIEHCYFNGGYVTGGFGNEAVQIDCASDTTWPGPYDDTICQDIVVRNCYFQNVSIAVGSHTEPANTNHARILICDNFCNLAYTAFVKGQAWSDVKIINNKAQNIGFGFRLVRASVTLRAQNDIEVIGNTFANVGYTPYGSGGISAIQIDGNATDTNNRPINVRIANNFITNSPTNGRHGISCEFIQRGSISDNVVYITEGCGIYVYGGSAITITGNSVTAGNGLGSTNYADIKLGGTSVQNDTSSCVVTGNICGTFKADYTTNCLITGNRFTTSATKTNSSSGSTMINNLIGATFG